MHSYYYHLKLMLGLTELLIGLAVVVLLALADVVRRTNHPYTLRKFMLRTWAAWALVLAGGSEFLPAEGPGLAGRFAAVVLINILVVWAVIQSKGFGKNRTRDTHRNGA